MTVAGPLDGVIRSVSGEDSVGWLSEAFGAQDDQPTLVVSEPTRFGGFDAYNPNGAVVYLWIFDLALLVDLPGLFASVVGIYGLTAGVRTEKDYAVGGGLALDEGLMIACSTSPTELLAPGSLIPITILIAEPV